MTEERAFIALRRLKVQALDEDGKPRFDEGPDGEKIRVEEWREPGDPVPEAKAWPNLRAFVNCGHVGLEGDPETVKILATRRTTETLDQLQRTAEGVDAQVAAGPRGKARKKPGPKPGAKRKGAAKKAAATKPAPATEEEEEPGDHPSAEDSGGSEAAPTGEEAGAGAAQ